MSKHRPLATITRCPLFPPGLHSPATFKLWTDANYTTFTSLTQGGAVIPFSSLQRQGVVTPKDQFQYLQLRHCIESWLKKSPLPRQLTAFEQICYLNFHKRGTVSTLYRSLGLPQSLSPPPYARKWEKDLGVPLPQANWKASWESIAHSSYNITTLETNYKILLRWYLTPDRVAKFDPSQPDTCFRGCPEKGTFFHTWWTCKVAQAFWKKTLLLVHRLLRINLPTCPKVLLLLVFPPGLSTAHRNLICHILNAAKQTLARAWYNPAIEMHEVYSRLSNTMLMEHCSAVLNDSVPRFHQTWDPWARQKDRLVTVGPRPSSPNSPGPPNSQHHLSQDT